MVSGIINCVTTVNNSGDISYHHMHTWPVQNEHVNIESVVQQCLSHFLKLVSHIGASNHHGLDACRAVELRTAPQKA